MRETLKRLGAESIVYGFGQVTGRAVQLLLVPILTRALTRGEYGIGELVAGYSQMALLILVMGMDGALARFFYEQPDREARIRMASSSLVFRLGTSLAATAAIALFAGPLAGQLMSGEAYRKYILLGAAALPFTLLVMFSSDVLRVTFQPWKFIGLNFVQTVCVTGLSLYFVLVVKTGVVGVLYGRLIGDAVAAIIGLVLTRHSIVPRFSRTVLRRMLSYGLPSVPAAFCFGLIAAADRYVLQRTRSIEEVAVYSVALKFFAVVSITISAFQLAYGPFAFARAKEPDAPRLYARVFALYLAGSALGALTLGAFAPELVRFLAPVEYAGAARPALWLGFAAIGLGGYAVASLGIGLALRTPLLAWCSGIGAAVAIAAQLTLTPRFGIEGAGAATFLGYFATAFVTYAIAQRVHPLPYRGLRMLLLLAGALGLGFALQRLVPAGFAGALVKLAGIAAFAAVCFALRIWKDSGSVAGWVAAPSLSEK